MSKGRKRANGEGSIFPYRNGWAAYVWVTAPTGEKTKKWAYGKTREEVHEKYVKLQTEARRGSIATSVPTLDQFLTYWLKEVVVEPDFAPLTIATYETLTRLYVRPELGKKRLDKLSVRDIRIWLNKTRAACQCCAQGKDARRPAAKQRCCAVGQCCQRTSSERTVRDALTVLRSALSYAMSEELISKNVASGLRIPRPRKKRKVKPWSVAEARQFLEKALADQDGLYAAYVLILVLGLRKGEVLGLTWDLVNLETKELFVGEQLQRVRRQLLRREVKTEASEAGLPLPEICLTALKLRKERQTGDRDAHPEEWQETGLVFTTRYGTPIEPRNFNRRFDYRIAQAGVRRITVHGTRGTCATLLAALDVHPRVAMRILRHSDIKVTMEVYTEATDEATTEALRKLGGTLGADPAA
ncbi:site-specific integrase [Nonomuraea sp. K274]|uniref:Site-specific integrase n=1 Tax=Nonomuraea cypriaca TaxID=1187855 RepID=A0A931AMJ0_9ACTN|nr:site-specific integrase [Nonomuraea cypriaca]MBF8194580.1 site-specific integrase [Nonomuraea cypriaca]